MRKKMSLPLQQKKQSMNKANKHSSCAKTSATGLFLLLIACVGGKEKLWDKDHKYTLDSRTKNTS